MIDEETKKYINETRAMHEFLTFLVMKDGDIRCGVVQNESAKFIMFFDLEKITKPDAKKRFISLVDQWWWQTGQSVPVDLYFGEKFDEFADALTGYPKKSLEQDPIGPTFSLVDRYIKRIKKRRVDIVNRV